jgi:aspartate/methionine/tyrosine aminotransferase
MRHIAPFHVMQLLERAQRLEAAGRDIVHMEIGEPDFPTPAPIVAAARRALDAGRTRYTPACGLPELREALARYYRERYGMPVAPSRIVVTPGASGALQLALGVLVDPGTRVVLADPSYPCNRHFVRLFEGEPVSVPVGAEQGYQLTPEQLTAAWDARTRVALVASPSNPTGTLVAPDMLAALADTTATRGGTLVVDEIYHGLVYGPPPPTALALGGHVLVVNSFSKYFGMTGWRLGWLVAPPELVQDIEKLAQNLFLAPPTLSQYAALAAFETDTLAELETRREAFAARRDYLVEALRGLGFGIPLTPQGAFYVYADCSFGDDALLLAQRLLDAAGVAVTPGIDFGSYRATRHLRFAYTTSLERLAEGVARIAAELGQPAPREAPVGSAWPEG